jgi:hypothetical protein
MRSLVVLVCCLLLSGTVASDVVTAQTAAAAITQYVDIDGTRSAIGQSARADRSSY